MKLKYFSVFALCAAILVSSCSKDGADGKTMLTRTTKEAAGSNCTYGGTKVETGIDENKNGTLDDNEVSTTQTKYVCDGAGAIYSNWIDVNVVTNSSPYMGEGYFAYKQVLPSTALTADVVNKGVVLLYYKNSSGYIVPVDRDDVYGLRDSDVNGNIFQIKGGYIYKQSYFAFLADGDAANITLMNGNGSAVRYVIIPGNSQGRAEDLRKLPYSEVAKLYNIQD